MAPGKAITDFFKPYTIPKSRIPDYEIEEEIVVATPRQLPPTKARNANEAQNAPPSTSSALSSMASISSQSTPTRVRTLQAVEIPWPPRATIPPVPQAPAATKLNTSFSSALSSAPHSSQSSSRRIVKNGVPAVTNSDSASVSSSSEDELADFDTLFPAKRRKLTPPGRKVTNPIDVASSSGASLRTSTRLTGERTARQYRSAYRPPSPPPTVTYKHSLRKIVSHNQKQAESQAKIAKAEAEVQDEDGQDAVAEKAETEDRSASAIAAAFTNTSEDYERMKAAIERTEAMKAEETFYYFRGEASVCPGEAEPYDFSVVDDGFDFLEAESILKAACTTGFLASLASKRPLPDRLVGWMQRALLVEKSEELCVAYVAVLAAATRHSVNSHENRTIPSLGAEFRSQEKAASGLPPNLKHLLLAMTVVTRSRACDPESDMAELASLVMLNNDEHVRSDLDLQIVVENTMQALLLSIGDWTRPALSQQDPTLGSDFWTPLLRAVIDESKLSRHMLARAISSLPATMPELAYFRRSLALHILLGVAADESISHISPDTGVRLLVRLKRAPEFAISERTDYTLLLSLTSLLDIALDAGFSDFAFLRTAQLEPLTASASSNALFSSTAKPTSPAEQAFNAQVDAFAAQLTQMKSRIRDAGTSHLKRTEAKSALERLVVRLEYAVRTRPKSRKGVFGKESNAGMGMGMEAFLKSAGKGADVVNENLVDGAVEDEDAS
ncbi:hypothetical protein B0A48_11692 [Cryoendolithus antarcticus]|uniref:Uncharacterized protein n=1 Tax=Cryoendolithus antarcticus TaxID=1507870 RepID=A0A1V8SSV2_9PEZI|nr:hypothetical protein B0A48_11692 [Cryoendolithus antarcticus]